MFKHYSMWKLKSSSDSKTKEEIIKILREELFALGEKVPEVKRLEFAVNLHSGDGAYDVMVCSVFQTQEDFAQKWGSHPGHDAYMQLLEKYRDGWIVVNYTDAYIFSRE